MRYREISLEDDPRRAQFLPEARRRQEAAREHGTLDDGEEPLDLLFLSSIPWLHYTALTQPTPIPADSNPRITWGKYIRQENGRETLGLSIEVNHRLVDGVHLGRFYESLQNKINELE